MEKFPRGGLIGKVVYFAGSVTKLRIPLYAANAGYFMVLSVFPALLLVLSILRYTDLQPEALVQVLESYLPTALMEGAEELIIGTYMSASGALVGLSAVTTLWSASRGVYGLLTGLNAIYGVDENRGYWYTRLISVGYTFLLLLVILMTLSLHVFGSGLIGFLTMIDHPVVIFLVDLIDFRFVLLLALQTLVFTLMFMALPNRPNRFRESLPGGVLTSLGWLVFSDMFSVYVENCNRYANIFGSIYAVALGMLWLYFCLGILFFGGALNRRLAEQKR